MLNFKRTEISVIRSIDNIFLKVLRHGEIKKTVKVGILIHQEQLVSSR